ncbi:MAG: hypothetical protein AB1730_09955 [Myxococcota bacterium]
MRLRLCSEPGASKRETLMKRPMGQESSEAAATPAVTSATTRSLSGPEVHLETGASHVLEPLGQPDGLP